MQLLAKFEQILYMGFRAALNFRKFKVVLDSMHRIALNVSLNLPIYYSFRHVLKPGTPEHRNTGTPEHHNTPKYPGQPEQPKKPGTPNLTVLFCFPNTDHVKKINVDVNVICFLRKTKELRACYKVYVSGAHY